MTLSVVGGTDTDCPHESEGGYWIEEITADNGGTQKMARSDIIGFVKCATEVLIEEEANPVSEFVAGRKTEMDTMHAVGVFMHFTHITESATQFKLAGLGFSRRCEYKNRGGKCSEGYERAFVFDDGTYFGHCFLQTKNE